MIVYQKIAQSLGVALLSDDHQGAAKPLLAASRLAGRLALNGASARIHAIDVKIRFFQLVCDRNPPCSTPP